ncbi:MAG: UDP-N-acetylmuramoyl-L-alanine--D-glutamate ligase [Alphaproteobacteria bacterium]|nr:UDP-N-acetylmuramoyl-L-alanine--D-glutamate ligase [Alphaproteobacteria bacterium]
MIAVPSLAGTIAAVMGLGRSGRATALALAASGAVVRAWDDDSGKRDAALAEGLTLADPLTGGLDGCALLVWSPGIPHTFPAPHPVAETAAARGVPMVCDVELLGRARSDCQFLAITGTNGKSTTTTLLGHIAQGCGLSSAAGGNLGTAALAMPELDPGGTYVMELSSYQIELLDSIQLDVAVLLNITPDHLARHGGIEGYVAAKRRLFRYLKPGHAAIVGMDDPTCRGVLMAILAASRWHAVGISAERRVPGGVYAPDGVLIDDTENDAVACLDLREIASLPGRHNWQNACAAFAAARHAGMDPDEICEALVTYPGLAHRQELVGTVNGVLYVNDSKATNADAAEKALVCYQDVYWIAGGQPKEGGIDALERHFGRIRHAFLIGEAAQAFGRRLDGKVAFTQCGDLGTAVARAHAMAQAERVAGAVVLLSPACASWDQFASFEQRGDVFRQLVREVAA